MFSRQSRWFCTFILSVACLPAVAKEVQATLVDFNTLMEMPAETRRVYLQEVGAAITEYEDSVNESLPKAGGQFGLLDRLQEFMLPEADAADGKTLRPCGTNTYRSFNDSTCHVILTTALAEQLLQEGGDTFNCGRAKTKGLQRCSYDVSKHPKLKNAILGILASAKPSDQESRTEGTKDVTAPKNAVSEKDNVPVRSLAQKPDVPPATPPVKPPTNTAPAPAEPQAPAAPATTSQLPAFASGNILGVPTSAPQGISQAPQTLNPGEAPPVGTAAESPAEKAPAAAETPATDPTQEKAQEPGNDKNKGDDKNKKSKPAEKEECKLADQKCEPLSAEEKKKYYNGEHMCLFGGYLNKYRTTKPTKGNCKPTTEIKIDGKEFHCKNNMPICNPIVFGFHPGTNKPYCARARSSASSWCDKHAKESGHDLEKGIKSHGLVEEWRSLVKVLKGFCAPSSMEARMQCAECAILNKRLFLAKLRARGAKATCNEPEKSEPNQKPGPASDQQSAPAKAIKDDGVDI